MIITFTKSFERSLKFVDNQELVKNTVERLISTLEKNIKPEGLGLKKLRSNIWEVRVTFSLRILFLIVPGELRLLIVGNHDEIKRFLKRI